MSNKSIIPQALYHLTLILGILGPQLIFHDYTWVLAAWLSLGVLLGMTGIRQKIFLKAFTLELFFVFAQNDL